MPQTTPASPKPAKNSAKSARAARPRVSLAEAMAALEAAGSEQTRKTYRRHGAADPMFGVSFATLKTLVKRIGVDHELGMALWETGNYDARNLAVKVVDPQRLSPGDLDRWAEEMGTRMGSRYVGMLAAEGPHAAAKAREWLAAPPGRVRTAGWALLGQLCMLDEQLPDAWFLDRLAEIEATIAASPNEEREAMNGAIIAIGCRDAALREAATHAAARIGQVQVDHGDTWCKTPDARESIDKAWSHAASKGFASPAAQERSRELQRLRC